jgi:LmbE family N-acetylglucosaminyl deacetylase
LVLTHHRDDLHQDHRLVGELTWNTFRDHLILEYEVPKYDGGLGSPNFFVPLPEDIVQAKVDGLMQYFGTQRSKTWFSEETFRGLMRLRGIESRAASGYAEGFYCRKAVWDPGPPRGAGA